jgi:nitrogen fixation NifU-like protein
MSELRDLYQEVILDHHRTPRNFRALPGANRRAEGHNPLCGDQLTVYLDLADGVIRDIGFQGTGCAISRAAASMMTADLKGKTAADAERRFRRFHQMLTQTRPNGEGDGTAQDLGKLAVFAGVREFPVRIKCATLPWHTLRAALADTTAPVSTE